MFIIFTKAFNEANNANFFGRSDFNSNFLLMQTPKRIFRKIANFDTHLIIPISLYFWPEIKDYRVQRLVQIHMSFDVSLLCFKYPATHKNCKQNVMVWTRFFQNNVFEQNKYFYIKGKPKMFIVVIWLSVYCLPFFLFIFNVFFYLFSTFYQCVPL